MCTKIYNDWKCCVCIYTHTHIHMYGRKCVCVLDTEQKPFFYSEMVISVCAMQYTQHTHHTMLLSYKMILLHAFHWMDGIDADVIIGKRYIGSFYIVYILDEFLCTSISYCDYPIVVFSKLLCIICACAVVEYTCIKKLRVADTYTIFTLF